MSPSPAALLLWLLPCALGLNGLRAAWALAIASALLYLLWLRRPPSDAPAGRLWVAWAGWAALSAAFSAEPMTGFAAFSRAAIGPAFLALASAAWRAPHRRAWTWGLLLCAQALGAGAWLFSAPSYRMTGVLIYYYNYTACLQAAAVCAALTAWLSRPSISRRESAALAAAAALSLAWIVHAQSRGALLACAIVGVASLLRFGRRRLAAMTVLALAAAVAWAATGGSLRDRLKLDRPGSNQRPAIWRSALAVCRDYPLLGQGPGQFQRGFLRHNFPSPPGMGKTRFGMRTAHAHSEFLQAAAEIGWPGLALWLAALAATFALASRAAEEDPSREAPLAAAACMLLQSLGDNVLNLPGMALVFYSALAAAAGKAGYSSPGRGPLALGWAALALSGWAWWPEWAVAHRLSRAHAAPSGPTAAAWARSALAVQPDNADLWQDLARFELLGSPNGAARALSALGEAESRNPTSGDIPLTAAEILRALGRWNACAAVAERALELEPDSLQARMLRSEAWLRLGDRRRAAGELREIAAIRTSKPIPEPDNSYNGMVLRFDERRLRSLLEETKGR